MDTFSNNNGIEHDKQFLCEDPSCGKFFSTKSNLLRHQRKGHVVQKFGLPRIPCGQCHRVFSTASNLRRHRRKFHASTAGVEDGNFVCSECMASFLTRKGILQHYREIHPELTFYKEHLGFFTRDDFLKWKTDVENQTMSQFVTLTGPKEHKMGKVHRYVCRQGGKTRLRNFGERTNDIHGTTTNRKYCPAQIFVHEIEDKIFVDFHATHLGHALEPSPKIVQHKKLVKTKREHIQTVLQSLMIDVEKCESYYELDAIGRKLDEIAPLLADAKSKPSEISETAVAFQYDSNIIHSNIIHQVHSYSFMTKPVL